MRPAARPFSDLFNVAASRPAKSPQTVFRGAGDFRQTIERLQANGRTSAGAYRASGIESPDTFFRVRG